MVRPERFELPAFWFVARRSIQLSYGRIYVGQIQPPPVWFPPPADSIQLSCGRISMRQILACALFALAPPDTSLVSASGGLYPAELRAHFI